MRVFFDSSAFAKRYVDEAGSDEVEVICGEATELGLSIICVPEIISAFNRRVREKVLTRRQYNKMKRRLEEETADATIINMTPPVVSAAIMILEDSPVRAMDALHIASALLWKADLFVSGDARQLSAAEKVQLKVRCVGDQTPGP
jgi:predicted nucleic acid-binding protein